MKKLFSLFTLIALLAVFQSQAIAGPYKIFDIGPMVVPISINNKSVVVGYRKTPDGHHSAFYYSRNVFHDLGTFNGTDSEALDVDSSGQIVGTFRQNGAGRGFKLTGAGFTDLFATAGLLEAVGINDSGTILGSVATADGDDHPAFLQNGVVKDLTLGGHFPDEGGYWPVGINASGQAIFDQTLCGSWECESGYLYSNGAATEIPLTATDLNNRGEVVGYKGMPSPGMIYKNGSIVTIESIGLESVIPTAINDVGEVVGNSNTEGGYHIIPFLYRNNALFDLNTLLPSNSGWQLSDIYNVDYDINNYGQIVGTGNLNGEEHGFLLSPTYTVSGVIKDASTGQGIAAVTVSIAGAAATTNSSGYFTLTGILPGTYTVTMTKSGFVSKTAKLVVDRDLSGLVFYLTPLPTYCISGTVHSGRTTGPALAGATVAIAGKSTTTSSTGTFSIPAIPSGTYTLTIYKFGYATRTVTGFLVNSNRTGLVFYLTPLPTYSISGTVRSGSSTGPVLPGATVAIAGKRVTTSSTGTFSILAIPAGTYTLTISKFGYATRTVTGFVVSSNRAGLVFYMTPLPTYAISGTVRSGSSTGPVLPGAAVAIAGKTTITSSTGTFSISGILAGTYTLTISKRGYTTRTVPGFVVSSNRSGLVFYLVPLPTYTISGTVRRGSATGPALSGATISIAGKSAITSSTGTFSISGILAGTYTLTISKSGYVTKSYSGYVITGNKTGLVFYLVPATVVLDSTLLPVSMQLQRGVEKRNFESLFAFMTLPTLGSAVSQNFSKLLSFCCFPKIGV